jgi:hypothetical protein
VTNLKIVLSGVTKAIDNYWRPGIVSGLIIFDCLVLCVCFVDGVRFVHGGLSFMSAIRVAFEAALDGDSVWLAIAVLIFFLVALPMVIALLSALVSPLEHWPKLFRTAQKGILPVHILLSSLIALLTMVAVAMEVLSGWQKAKIVSYSFISSWLAVVLIGKPVYVFYVSPIIKKFLVRVSAGHKTKIAEVVEEVVTEDRMGEEH